jgi:hypothetical protein
MSFGEVVPVAMQPSLMVSTLPTSEPVVGFAV